MIFDFHSIRTPLMGKCSMWRNTDNLSPSTVVPICSKSMGNSALSIILCRTFVSNFCVELCVGGKSSFLTRRKSEGWELGLKREAREGRRRDWPSSATPQLFMCCLAPIRLRTVCLSLTRGCICGASLFGSTCLL